MEERLSEISIVGKGLESNSGFLFTLCKALQEAGVRPVMVATTGIRITIVLPESQFESALASSHSRYFGTTKD